VQAEVDVCAYMRDHRPSRFLWCSLTNVAPNVNAAYPVKARVPGRGVGQWKYEEVRAWRAERRFLEDHLELYRQIGAGLPPGLSVPMIEEALNDKENQMENSYQALHFEKSENDGQWYWHVKSPNGQIVATGGEGYSSEGAARRGYAAAQRVMVGLAAQDAALQSEAMADQADKELAAKEMVDRASAEPEQPAEETEPGDETEG
jgi:uncharacterized protein YegP (UPF0339 family)